MLFLLAMLFSTCLVAQNFICEQDRQAHEYIVQWASSDKAKALATEKNISIENAAFNIFLQNFVRDEQVAYALANRPEYDFKDLTVQDESSEEYAIRQAQEEQMYLNWRALFQVQLERFGGHVIENPTKKCPDTIVFWFDAFSQFIIKMRATNTYRLGFYNPSGDLGCAIPGMYISEYEFPLQEVSRVLYADQVGKILKEKEYTDLVSPRKFLFIFPGFEQAPLDDKHLFVVADRIQFDPLAQKDLFSSLRSAYREYVLAAEPDLSDPHQKLLHHLFDVVMSAGLWDVSSKTQNTVLCLNDQGNPVLAFLDLERPPFGAGNPIYFFHENDEECMLNGRMGMQSMIDLLVEPEEDFNTSDDWLVCSAD
jgi:hypothetical protein